LDNPTAGGMPSDVAVDNLLRIVANNVANNKEVVQGLEGDCRNHEKIHVRGDCVAMIAKEG
jgi:hypothetical protein